MEASTPRGGSGAAFALIAPETVAIGGSGPVEVAGGSAPSFVGGGAAETPIQSQHILYQKP